MSKLNQTGVIEFILLGFQDLHRLRMLFFLFLLVIYTATMTGNLLIIGLVSTSLQLRSPMYFFLAHLSFCDILISTNVGPKAMETIVTGSCHISATSCINQLFFFGAFALIECSLLTVMSYDRYLAICDPLHYPSIMNHCLSHYLAVFCWVAGFLLSMITEILVFRLHFCGPNIINHFFCDLAPLLEVSCSDTVGVEIQVSITAIAIVISQLLFVCVTYICIFTSILHISSISGRNKVFSTCSSHLTVVSTYYGTLIALYVAPSRGYSLSMNKVLSLMNTVITPLFNPIIYSLRNKEIRIAISKTILKWFTLRGK